MDVRDILFWASEAGRHRLARRAELYNAALLPWQEAGTIRAIVGELSLEKMEADMAEDGRGH